MGKDQEPIQVLSLEMHPGQTKNIRRTNMMIQVLRMMTVKTFLQGNLMKNLSLCLLILIKDQESVGLVNIVPMLIILVLKSVLCAVKPQRTLGRWHTIIKGEMGRQIASKKKVKTPRAESLMLALMKKVMKSEIIKEGLRRTTALMTTVKKTKEDKGGKEMTEERLEEVNQKVMLM